MLLTFFFFLCPSFFQPKQRTSLSSSLDVQRPVNHSCEPSEVSSSLGYASFSTSPPASPPLSPNQEDSAGSNDDCHFTGKTQETEADSEKRACTTALALWSVTLDLPVVETLLTQVLVFSKDCRDLTLGLFFAPVYFVLKTRKTKQDFSSFKRNIVFKVSFSEVAV